MSTLTVIEVRPANPRSSADVQAAEQTRVDFAAGSLHVSTPRRPRLLLFGTGPSVEIDVALPEGSTVDVEVAAGDVTCDGRFGDVDIDTKYGEVRVDTAAAVRARSQAGDITVAAADGRIDVATAYGDVSVERAEDSVDASTKYGEVRVRDAQGAPPSIPFWLGERPGRTPELSSELSDLRRELAAAVATPGDAPTNGVAANGAAEQSEVDAISQARPVPEWLPAECGSSSIRTVSLPARARSPSALAVNRLRRLCAGVPGTV